MNAPRQTIFFLAATGGCVDGVGFMLLGGLFIAHMSGNTASLGAYFGQADWLAGFPHLFAIPVFVIGITLGHFWLARAPGAMPLLLVAEAMLLAVFAAFTFSSAPAKDSPAYFALCFLPLFAMGLQNATIRTTGNTTFHTTYVTGVLDTLGESLGKLLGGRSEEPAALRQKARQAASVWSCYTLGAIVGSAGLLAFRSAILLLPILLLLGIAAMLSRQRD